MLNVKKQQDSVRVVYDIALDSTFCNALGINILHNTDG